MKIIDLEQNTEEWLVYRKGKIGASDIGTLMEGSEKEVYDLLQEKRGVQEKYTTEAMRRGSDMEESAFEWLLNRPRTRQDKLCALHKKPHNWLMASFDYFDAEKKEGAEIKCPKVVLDVPSEHTHYKRWWWQIQAQMAVSGLKRWRLLVYSPAKQKQEWIERDDKAIEQLLEKGDWFYDILVNFKELPKPNVVVDRDDEKARDWANAYSTIDEMIKRLEEEKEVLRDEGLALAGEDSFSCGRVKVLRIPNKETIDYTRACKDHGIDLSAYVNPPKSPYTWRISVK